MEEADGHQHAEGRNDEDGGRRDRLIKIVALELAVHDEWQGLRPAPDGGRTIGRSTTASSQPLPRKDRRARTTARGRPSATVSTRLIAVVYRLSHRASRTTGDVSATWSDPTRIDRPTRASTGRPRKSV